MEGIQNFGDKAVMCQRLNFQNDVLYCHEINVTTVFMVQLVAGEGTKTQALAFCHADASGMNHELLCYILKVDPGPNLVCHFLSNNAAFWVPNLVVDNAYHTNISS